jgi:hypothetical protein
MAANGKAMKLAWLGLILIALSSPSFAADRWFCAANVSDGFAYDQTEGWHTAVFNTRKLHYILGKDDNGFFVWTPLGRKEGLGCIQNVFHKGYSCGNEDEGAIINLDTLRFTSWYHYGYVDGSDDNDNTPSIEIGQCSPT